MKKNEIRLSDFLSNEISKDGLKLINGKGVPPAPVKEPLKDSPVIIIQGPGGPERDKTEWVPQPPPIG